MERLNIKDIINNARDELERARELLRDNEDAINSTLINDIDTSLVRLQDVNERIDFALIIAVYTGMINAQNRYESECDNSNWRAAYLEEASKVELEYFNGYVDSEWAYETADAIAKELYEGELAAKPALASTIEQANQKRNVQRDVCAERKVDDLCR